MADKVRVAHVIPRYYPIFGGAETQCRLLVQHLRTANNLEVPFLLTGRVERGYAEQEQIDEVCVYRLGVPGIGKWQWYCFYLAASWFLMRRRGEFDVIHCHATSTMGFSMTVTGALLRKPVVLKLSTNGELLGDPVNSTGIRARIKSRLRTAMAGYLARRARIVALNRQGASEVEAAAPGRSVTIPNGIDRNQYHPLDPSARTALRAASGFSERDIVLLFVGRFVARKGIDVLLSAFERLKSDTRLNLVHLCLAGGGELQTDAINVLEAADTRSVNSRIHILAPKIPAVEYYQMADVFVFPSQREGLPNVVLEALAIGLPCILSDIDPHVELKETNPEADIRLFRSGDAEHLACTVQAAFESIDLPVATGPQVVCLAETYRIERVAHEYGRLYRTMLLANQ